MTTRSAVAMVRLAILFFLTGTPAVALLAARYPAQDTVVVLVGALLVGIPLGVGLCSAMIRGLEDEFAARYRLLEPRFLAAAGLSGLGLILAVPGSGRLAFTGGLLSALGLAAAFWLLFKTSRSTGAVLLSGGGTTAPGRQGSLGDPP